MTKKIRKERAIIYVSAKIKEIEKRQEEEEEEKEEEKEEE